MVDDYLKLLDFQESFPTKIGTIIESFISFYGEEKRTEISEKKDEIINKRDEIIKKLLEYSKSQHKTI